MRSQKYRWLAGLIYAHRDHRLFGRTRLQKEVKLLQRLGLPTDYEYTTHFYGPYSEGVQADVGLLEDLNLVREEGGTPWYVFRATDAAALPEIERYRDKINLLEAADPITLEVAATYDAYREMGFDHANAEKYTSLKKGNKWREKREEALDLLRRLSLLQDA